MEQLEKELRSKASSAIESLISKRKEVILSRQEVSLKESYIEELIQKKIQADLDLEESRVTFRKKHKELKSMVTDRQHSMDEAFDDLTKV